MPQYNNKKKLMTEKLILPSVEDTRNWREESEPYRVSEWSFRLPNTIDYASRHEAGHVSPLIPIRLAELIWRDPELMDATQARKIWCELVEDEPFTGSDDPRSGEKPTESYNLLKQFEAWYILRVGQPAVHLQWSGCAEAVLFKMLDGEFSSFEDERLLNYVTSGPWRQFFSEA